MSLQNLMKRELEVPPAFLTSEESAEADGLATFNIVNAQKYLLCCPPFVQFLYSRGEPSSLIA